MKNDRKQRETWARVDGPHRQDLIESARHIIYNMNRPVDCDRVELLLKRHSYVPTEVKQKIALFWPFDKLPLLQNAFSVRLSTFPKFNLFDMFVVDLMHEVEIGVWRSLFIHLLRILQAVDPRLIHELDLR